MLVFMIYPLMIMAKKKDSGLLVLKCIQIILICSYDAPLMDVFVTIAEIG